MAIALLHCQISSVHATTPADAIQLSHAEQAWLSNHPVVRVGVDADYAPYSFQNSSGNYQGIALDYMSRISQMLGIQFEIIPDLSWPQILQNTENRTIDVVATAVITPNRRNYMEFTGIYIPTPLVIMTRINDNSIKRPADLVQKRVALVKDYSSSQRVIDEYPEIRQIPVDTPLDGISAVAAGAADAYVGVIGVNTYLMATHGITNLKVAADFDIGKNGQRFGVRKDWPELVSILDKALGAMTEQEKLSLLTKWIPIHTTLDFTRKPFKLLLTEEEKNWLEQHKEFRLAVDPDFAPVEFIDKQGDFSGIAADYVALLNERLNINMRPIPGLSWSDAIERAKRGEIDVFSAITPTQDRKRYLHFTEPYFEYPFVIFTRNDYPFIAGLESLNGDKVAVVKDYVTHELVPIQYPNVDLVSVSSTREGLAAVSTGKVAAFVGDTATTTYVIRKFNFTNVKLAAPTDIKSSGHSFAVRKDWKLFSNILDKALDSISPQERLQISKKWIDIEVEKFPRYWIWLAEGAAGLAIIFVIISSVLRIQVRKRTTELSLKNQQLEKEAIERRRMESALIDSEHRLSQFFHATFEMVFFHDHGKILDVNPAARDNTGYDTSELIGRNILEYVSPESKQKVMINMASGIEGPYEINILSKAGAKMPVEIHARTFDIDGYKGSVVSLRDISERKKNEEALQRAYDELEIKVEERTRELVDANLKLQELDRLKSMFIASVSHELRTPLNSIIGFSSIMMRESFGEMNKKYKDYSSRINKSGQHLLALITDIIDLSKIESGRIDVIRSSFTIESLVNEAIENIKQQAVHKNLSISVNITGEIHVYTDRRRLMQCVLNFLSNAVKYSETGGIHIQCSEVQDQIKLSVKDTGIGISKQDLARLFAPFERIDSHLRVKAGGTGLGLYLTRKIARELLKGNVGATSEPGAGSIFWIQIPKNLILTESENDKSTIVSANSE